MKEFIIILAFIAIVYANNYNSCDEYKKFVEVACEKIPHDENNKDGETYVKISTTEFPPELCELRPPKPKKKYWFGFLG